MKLILLIILTIPTLVYAEKKITPKDMSMLGKIDESNFQEKPNEKKVMPIVESKNESRVTLSCKNKTGLIYNQGQIGYDDCLNELKNRSDFSKKNSGVNVNDNKEATSAGINFKIGD